MNYKTILVSLNEIDRLDPLLEVVAELASMEDAHVIGLYVIPAPAVFPAVGPYALPEIFDNPRLDHEQSSSEALPSPFFHRNRR